jgi:hypothetical protein
VKGKIMKSGAENRVNRRYVLDDLKPKDRLYINKYFFTIIEEDIHGVVRDISINGMGIEINEDSHLADEIFAQKKKFFINMELGSHTLTAEAEYIWGKIEKDTLSGGIRILSMAPEHRLILSEIIEEIRRRM